MLEVGINDGQFTIETIAWNKKSTMKSIIGISWNKFQKILLIKEIWKDWL
jgi:hypothetical protein